MLAQSNLNIPYQLNFFSESRFTPNWVITICVNSTPFGLSELQRLVKDSISYNLSEGVVARLDDLSH